MPRFSIPLLAAGALLPFGAAPGLGADPVDMLAACRARAANTLKVSPLALTLKYQGRRAGRTHAVIGSVPTPEGDQTFQCSFDAGGSRITRFVVNRPSPQAPSGESALNDAAARAGAGRFDATGKIPCAEYPGQPLGQCGFGVARAPGGTAAVAVRLISSRTRIIFFENGKPLGSDWSQADGKGAFRASRKADLFFISIGDERYEIPEAVVSGG